jgi:hypothetical protein
MAHKKCPEALGLPGIFANIIPENEYIAAASIYPRKRLAKG